MNRSIIRFQLFAFGLFTLILLTWQFTAFAQPPAAPFPVSGARKPNAAIAWNQPLLTTYRRIQNLNSSATSAITLTAYNLTGSVQSTASTTAKPFTSALIDNRVCCNLPSGFAGSSVITAGIALVNRKAVADVQTTLVGERLTEEG